MSSMPRIITAQDAERCTTHHVACDCREWKLQKELRELKAELAEAVQHYQDVGGHWEAAEQRLEQQQVRAAAFVEKVKRLQGELLHGEFCQMEETGALDGSHCGACLVLEDFGITEDDISALMGNDPAAEAATS